MSAQPSSDLINRKPATPLERHRALILRRMASLSVPQNTKLLHDMPTKQKPVFGVFASV